jgi:hypothetical protein
MREHENAWAKALHDGTAAPAGGRIQDPEAAAAGALEAVQARVRRHSPEAFARFMAKKEAAAEAQARGRKPGAGPKSSQNVSSLQRRGLSICNGGRAR